MQRFHNFMDRIREKPVAERRKMLFKSSLLFGGMIGVFGFWNLFTDLISLNNNPEGDILAEESVEKVSPASPFSSLSNDVSNVWTAVRGELKKLNDKLGSEKSE